MYSCTSQATLLGERWLSDVGIASVSVYIVVDECSLPGKYSLKKRIAETFAALVAGKKVSPEVRALAKM